MKYRYKFDEFVFENGNKRRIIIMEEDKYRMVAQFLMSDIQGSNPQYAFDALDDVLNGKSKYEELSGNACCVEIHGERARIYDKLAADGEGDWCEVETRELRNLVEIWSKEFKRFRAEQKAEKQRAQQKRGVMCPLCEENGLLHEAVVKKTSVKIYLCEECNRIWLSSDMRKDNCQSFKTFMTEQGFAPYWSEFSTMKIL